MQRKNHDKIRITIDENLWENIAAVLSTKFSKLKDNVNVSLTIPLCIGYKKQVSSEAFLAIVSDCNASSYPYQIVLYKNPNDNNAVQKWLKENKEAIERAGENVIDEANLRTTQQWKEASQAYDAFFNGSGINGTSASLQNKHIHEQNLLKDAGKFLSRTSPQFDQRTMDFLLAPENAHKSLSEKLKNLSPEIRELLQSSIDHVILEIKDCMVRMMRKQSDKTDDKADTRLNFLLYDGKLYEAIGHVITLAESLGYVKESITHATYTITAQSPQAGVAHLQRKHALPVAKADDDYKQLALYVDTVGPSIARTLVQYSNASPAQIAEALVNSFAIMQQKYHAESRVSPPRNDTLLPPNVYSGKSSAPIMFPNRSSNNGLAGSPSRSSENGLANSTPCLPLIKEPDSQSQLDPVSPRLGGLAP